MRHAMRLFVWLRALSWPALRHQAGRQALAVLAIALGVALSYGVHLLNDAALAEFGSAAASLNGQPDLELRSARGHLDESIFGRVATHPQVALASPVLELPTYALAPDGKRLPVRVVGVDALSVAAMAPLANTVSPAARERVLMNDIFFFFLFRASARHGEPAMTPVRTTLLAPGRTRRRCRGDR